MKIKNGKRVGRYGNDYRTTSRVIATIKQILQVVEPADPDLSWHKYIIRDDKDKIWALDVPSKIRVGEQIRYVQRLDKHIECGRHIEKFYALYSDRWTVRTTLMWKLPNVQQITDEVQLMSILL